MIIAIDASDKSRYNRALSRNRVDDSKDLNMIKERDRRELGWGLGTIIASADIVIINEDNLDDFKNKIKKVLERL